MPVDVRRAQQGQRDLFGWRAEALSGARHRPRKQKKYAKQAGQQGRQAKFSFHESTQNAEPEAGGDHLGGSRQFSKVLVREVRAGARRRFSLT